MFAIVEIGGKQYRVEKGTKLNVEALSKEGAILTLNKVFLINDGKVHIGKPLLEGAYVTAKVISCKKGDKIRVYKMHAKKRYHKSFGHRQIMCQVEIDEIKLTGGTVTKKAELKVEAKEVKKLLQLPKK